MTGKTVTTKRHASPLAGIIHGFTILEMSVVLVIIALIVGGVTIGRDVYRSAYAERISSRFVQGWALAYDNYVASVGAVPGDDVTNPSGKISGGTQTALCRDDLRRQMLLRGITMPDGRAENNPYHYGYQDAHGVPHNIEVCFINILWSEPGATINVYVTRQRNVMRLQGVTPELATLLDQQIDGHVDARFGRFREDGQQASTAIDGAEFSRTNADAMNGGTASNDAQVAEVTTYLLMSQ
jgi:prepilin-type N-terminal cleavage/methylation domain-containing protein